MKTLTLAVVIAVPLCLPLAAFAESELPMGFSASANVALATDYAWRGVSQTDEDPAIQGGFDLSHKTGFYAGVWASNVDFNDGDEAHLELDLYAGYSTAFENGLSLDLGLIHYDYPGAAGRLEYDFEEVYVGLGYTIKEVALSAKYSYSDDFTASQNDQEAHYVEAGLEYTLPLSEPFNATLGLHYGHSFGDAFDAPGMSDSYDDFSVSLSKEVMGFDLGLTLTGTDNDGDDRFGDLADNRVILAVSKSF